MTEPAPTVSMQHASITDLAFQVSGASLPVEHAEGLSRAVLERLAWLQDEPLAGIHQIQVAPSANGWMRPDADGLLSLSRRTRLVLRLPEDRLADAAALQGAILSVGGFDLTIGPARPRTLALQPEQFARHVISGDDESEGVFLNRVAERLQAQGIASRKLLCGRTTSILTGTGPLRTRSLLVVGLSASDARQLQACPLGEGRLMGCGLFLPHKGIAAVFNGSVNEQGMT